MKRFMVTKYYSGFFQKELIADNVDDAIQAVTEQIDSLDISIDYNEVATNLEPMPELDHAEPAEG